MHAAMQSSDATVMRCDALRCGFDLGRRGGGRNVARGSDRASLARGGSQQQASKRGGFPSQHRWEY